MRRNVVLSVYNGAKTCGHNFHLHVLFITHLNNFVPCNRMPFLKGPALKKSNIFKITENKSTDQQAQINNYST